jgi:dipeptidyl aminopeptidase/acylaminoacyl peptidase
MELPTDLHELLIASTLDGSLEPCLCHLPSGDAPVPLLVGLHTWSADRFNQIEAMLPRCRERGWALVLPEFRGPNLTTNLRARQAGGSTLAQQDILDALDCLVGQGRIDQRRVFMLGGSGGGHMALMMAARAPARFAAISAWVPITDLAAWHRENPNYALHVEAVCGGPPGSSDEVDAEYRERSPLTHAEAMRRARLAVHHGRFDRSVPYTHTRRLTQALEAMGAPRFYLDLFDGGHEIRYDVAFAWFDACSLQDAAGEALTG